MDIKTKYATEDKVWIMKNNLASEGEIMSARINVTSTETTIEYYIYDGDEELGVYIKEAEVFASKDDLIKSL